MAEQHLLPGREQELPRHGLREIAVGLLDQPAIAEIEHVAAEGERVAVAALALRAAPAAFEEMRRLPDQIEAHIGEAEIDLDAGAWPHHSPSRWPRIRLSSPSRSRQSSNEDLESQSRSVAIRCA